MKKEDAVKALEQAVGFCMNPIFRMTHAEIEMLKKALETVKQELDKPADK